MAVTLYKPGQGYYTRMLSAIGAGMLVLAGAAWLYLTVVPRYFGGHDKLLVIQACASTGLVVAMAIAIYIVLNRPRVVDFMIAVEAEMKKVNWPSQKEVIGSTWVVILGTFLFAGLLFLVNLVFGWFFLWIGILSPTSPAG